MYIVSLKLNQYNLKYAEDMTMSLEKKDSEVTWLTVLEMIMLIIVIMKELELNACISISSF